MLKEINTMIGAVCSAVSTTSLALEDGSKILRLKGAAAKQCCALESVKAIMAAKEGLSQKELEAAAELLASIED